MTQTSNRGLLTLLPPSTRTTPKKRRPTHNQGHNVDHPRDYALVPCFLLVALVPNLNIGVHGLSVEHIPQAEQKEDTE